MGQENFAGPEYFTEFDPEKFIRDLQQQKEMDEEEKLKAQQKQAENEDEQQA
ncbi:hypothetical protein [uncultured Corynebacterium sp.]|uniref:hypothetical protein n=1 Tax=uncultured Corynebacterium sp. TaxID=159447 RepID=UPI0025D5B080|nr:hypothetical protein [uncultured Corynebacterium sp.]